MLDKISQLFKIRPKNFLGVDVGASSIRMVELARKGNIIRLENYGEMGLPRLNDKPFKTYKKRLVTLSNEEISKSINRIIEKAGIKVKDTCFSIPDFGSFFTNINLPVMDKNEIAEAVKYQARPYIPLPLEDVALDWSITEGEPSKTKLKVLVAAIPNNIIHQYKDIARLADLNLKFLEPEVFSLARSTISDKEESIVGLIDIGATSTTCSVLEKGAVKISHSFNVAGNELTDVIARSLNIDYNKAEEFKRKQGLLPNDEVKDSKDVRKLLLPLVGSILQEVKKAFRNFYLQEGKEVQKIILAGGLSKMPGLKEFFAVELKKPVSVIDPFLKLTAPPILVNTLKEIGPYYGIAIGLALKGLE